MKWFKRFFCCGKEEKGEVYKDPVCGMEVSEDSAACKSEYKGKIYYFCAFSCKEKFEREPEKYLK